MTTALILGVLAVAVVVFRILKEAEGGAGTACPQPVLSCYKWLGKALPLSAIKIVVVVLQIVTQVGVVVADPAKEAFAPERIYGILTVE